MILHRLIARGRKRTDKRFDKGATSDFDNAWAHWPGVSAGDDPAYSTKMEIGSGCW
jgi:hypothetical protein